MSGSSLQVWDWVVFTSFLLISLAIGVYHGCTGGKQRSTGEFISGDKQLSVLPTMLSLFVSYQSAILILGMTAEVYRYGMQGSVLHVVAFIIACVIAERLYVPWMYRLRLTSVFEYLQLRYDSKLVRVYGVVLGLCFMCLYMGAALFAPATALQAVTGFPISATIIIMAAVATIYTSMGGMKAVIYTDVFQAVILSAGILAIMIQALLLASKGGDVLQIAQEGGRMIWADFNLDPRERNTFWGFVFGMSWTWSVVFGLTQPSVQRYSALPTLSKARQVVLFNMIPLSVLNLLICVCGVAIYAYYVTIRCDPLDSDQVSSPNQIVPFFVVNSFSSYPGVSGLFMAALFSGAMSSVSSSLSSAAAVAWKDLIKLANPEISDQRGTFINKGLVVFFSAIAVGIAFLASSMPSVPLSQTAFTFFGVCSGPLGGIFIMGGLFRFANWKGALSGCIAGTTFTLWVGIGAMTIQRPSYTLPPAPIDGCPHYGNYTLDNDLNITSTTTMQHITATAVNSQQQQQEADRERYGQYSGIEHLYTISYIWYALFGTAVTLMVGTLVSCCTGGAKSSSSSDSLDDSLFLHLQGLCSSPFDCGEEKNEEKKKCGDKIKKIYRSVSYKSNSNKINDQKGETESCLREENGEKRKSVENSFV